MNVGMILPYSRNAYVGNFRHAPLASGGSAASAAAMQPTKVARAMLPSALRNNPLVGALSHAPHSQGLKSLITDPTRAGRGAGAGAGAGAGVGGPHMVTRIMAVTMRPTSPQSIASSDGRASPFSCSSADHEYGGISNWASRMGKVLDRKEDHLESWSARSTSDHVAL